MAANRRVALSSLAGDPVENVPGESAPVLTRLKVSQIAPTPFNTREDFGTDEELVALGESLRVRQLQPVVVVSAKAYAKIAPEHMEKVGNAEYVLVNGECRWMSAMAVSLPHLDAVIRESLAADRATFVDAVVTENIDRRNLNPIEEARAVDAMVQECGTAAAAAKIWRRSEGWISQRRGLLKLIPELQKLLVAGDMPIRVGREICTLPADEQWDAWLKSLKPEPEPEAEEEQEPVVPAQRTPPAPPSMKASARLLRRFRDTHGADALASLVLTDLEQDEAVTFMTAAARHLSKESLDEVVSALLEHG